MKKSLMKTLLLTVLGVGSMSWAGCAAQDTEETISNPEPFRHGGTFESPEPTGGSPQRTGR